MTVLRLEGLEKSFAGFRAVDGVSLALAAGEIVALIGPNGAGKTTTFNIANGQLAPDRGCVLLEGRNVTGLGPSALSRLGLGRTFQVTATFGSMSVAENIRVAILSRAREQGLIRSAAAWYRSEINALLAEIGIAHLAQHACGSLSYGDLKRVDLALALAGKPRVLLMDEPTAGMAPAERNQLMALAMRSAREHNTAVLFTEHDIDLVFGHAERVIVMNRGKIIAEGTSQQVRGSSVVRDVYLGRRAVHDRP